MAEAVLFSLATAILKSITFEIAKPGGSFASQKIQLLCGGAEGELKSLQDTVQTIQAVLLDAEKKQWHDNQVKLWLRRLKDVLYDVQDLFDDVATENLRRKVTSGNKMSKASVSFVAIVGKGGLGKTALARLVYNDGEVKEHFGLKMWVCVSDVFNVNVIIKEILKSAKDNCQEHDDEMKRLLQDLENKPIDQLPSLLHEILGRKKYLLVLDDLWNEDRHKWLKLGDWLEGGLQGSKILVTTRSHKVAKVTDAKSVIHVLNGLSEDKSWNLFRKMAFGDGVESSDPELEETGRDIVKKCAGVPLAIRTIGGLLYGKNKDEWLRYKVRELPEIPEIDEVDDGIMQVLKFSYDRLPSCLKHCFAYCSLFPKDYSTRKI
ncbi:hypothetical protein NL676_021172 [Syzygium grande]|nr:hypothetical protein NL676_021172 [Syzygium grande]